MCIFCIFFLFDLNTTVRILGKRPCDAVTNFIWYNPTYHYKNMHCEGKQMRIVLRFASCETALDVIPPLFPRIFKMCRVWSLLINYTWLLVSKKTGFLLSVEFNLHNWFQLSDVIWISGCAFPESSIHQSSTAGSLLDSYIYWLCKQPGILPEKQDQFAQWNNDLVAQHAFAKGC